MRINPLKNDRYKIISLFMNKIKRLGAFKHFNSSNIMLFNFGDERAALTFACGPGLDNYGLSLFLGDEGMNTLYDMLMMSDKSFHDTDFNLVNVIFKKDVNLEIGDIDFLNKRGIKIKKYNNIILNTFKPGFALYNTTTREADFVIKVLASLHLVLSRKLEDVIKMFSVPDLVVSVDVDFDNLVYSVNGIELPYVEREYERVKPSEDDLEEFKGLEMKEYDMSIIARANGIPVKIKDCNKPIVPLMVTFNTMDAPLDFYDTMISLPSDYRSQMIYFLKEYFTSHGLPKLIYINNRYLYFYLVELLQALGIEVILQIENEAFDRMIDDICIAYYIAYDLNMKDYIYPLKEEDMIFTNECVKKFFIACAKGDDIVEEKVIRNPVVGELIKIINEASGYDDEDLEIVEEEYEDDTNEEYIS